MSSLVKAKRPEYIYVNDPINEEPEIRHDDKGTMILDIEKDIVVPTKPKDRRSRAQTVIRDRPDTGFLRVSVREPKQ